MSQHMELRTIFADSTWANQNDDGSFSINLSEQLEIAPEHVLFLDNISICGNLPQIALHNRKLYVLERTPKNFKYKNFVVTLGSSHFTSFIEETTLNNTAELAPYIFHIDLSPSGDLLLFYPDDTECTFVGRFYAGKTSTTFSSNDPFVEVSGRYNYTTGAMHWSPRFPSQYSPWMFQEFPATETQDTIRVIDVPIGDYTAQAMREELQRLLQDGAFQGRIPEGSGTQYLVSGSGNQIRIRTNETLVRADTFWILPDSFLRNRFNLRAYQTQWSPEQPRSTNSVLGNTASRNLARLYGDGDISFSGFWTSPQSHPTRTHLDGTWLAAPGITTTIRRDILFGEYEILSPSGIHLRYFRWTQTMLCSLRNMQLREASQIQRRPMSLALSGTPRFLFG